MEREAAEQSRIILPPVREGAALAALDAAVGIDERPAAVLAQGVERAIAKQAVEVLLRHAPVAGEIFAVPILKELIVFVHGMASCPVNIIIKRELLPLLCRSAL